MRNEIQKYRGGARAGGLAAAIVVLAVFVGCSSTATAPSVTVGPTVQAAATQAVAPTTQALANQAAPTVSAAATQIAPTAQALANQAAPTVSAAATQIAPTAQALANTAAPFAATVTTSAPVRVTNVKVETTDSTVALQNVGNQAVDLSNWSLQVGTVHTQLPAGLNVPPGQTVTVHTGSGTSSPTDVYLGTDAQAIASQLRPGVQIVLANPSGSPVSSFVVPNG
jgi:competence protein ComEC